MKTAIITFQDSLGIQDSWHVVEILFGQGTDGESAYEAAVKGGFEGTEAEFNESISKFIVSDEVRHIKVVNEYPEVEEPNTLYIKLGNDTNSR